MFFYSRLSVVGIIAIVLLRVVIGYHFYMEGVSKVRAGNFDSQGFLNAAEGPLAPAFHALIWDYDGLVRLDKAKLKELFKKAAADTKAHFALTDAQAKNLEALQASFLEKIDETFAEGGEDVEKYWVNFKALQEKATDPTKAEYRNVASLQGHVRKVAKDSRTAVLDTMKSVDTLWTQYERRLNGVASKEQFAAKGPYRFKRPGDSPVNTNFVNQFIPIFDMCIGILLMIGLLTPLAATLGGLFLLSVVLSQMPGYPGTSPTYYQAIECIALFALAATDAGRYAGLDFIPWAFWRNRAAKSQAAATSVAPAAA